MIFCVTEPAGIVTVPEPLMKSAVDAVPGVVDKSTCTGAADGRERLTRTVTRAVPLSPSVAVASATVRRLSGVTGLLARDEALPAPPTAVTVNVVGTPSASPPTDAAVDDA